MCETEDAMYRRGVWSMFHTPRLYMCKYEVYTGD
jgi:hypothetical protein